MKKTLLILLALPFIVSGAFAAETKKGESEGVVTAKGQRWIEVLTDGSVRRYTPYGILPEDPKKLDGRLANELRKIKVNQRVKIGWEMRRSYFRVVSIQSLEK